MIGILVKIFDLRDSHSRIVLKRGLDLRYRGQAAKKRFLLKSGGIGFVKEHVFFATGEDLFLDKNVHRDVSNAVIATHHLHAYCRCILSQCLNTEYR